MADLLIRNIEPSLKRQLEERARKHGRSLSDEAKTLIRRGVTETDQEAGFGTRLFSLLPDEFRSDDLVFERPDDTVEPPPGFE
jgi:hypothetical protein